MAGKYCFSRFKERSIVLYPFRLADVVPYLYEDMQTGSIAFLVEDMSINKYYSEKEVPDLNSIEDFLSFCNQLKEPFVQEFEIENEISSICIDDENYMVLEFENELTMRMFFEEILKGFKLYTPELFNAVLQSVSEGFVCVSNGEVFLYKDYYDLMQSE